MKLADQIKQAVAALAVAEVPEWADRRTMHQSLSAQPPAPRPQAAPVGKLIALGVGSALTAPVVDYVAGACRRMGADLLLLTADAERLRALLAPHLPRLAGIRCTAEELPTPSRRTVSRLLSRRTEVLFAVCGAGDDPVSTLVHGRHGLFDPRTPVPVVMVGNGPNKPAHALGQPRLAHP